MSLNLVLPYPFAEISNKIKYFRTICGHFVQPWILVGQLKNMNTLKRASEHDQEIPISPSADQSTAPHGRDI